MTRSILEKLTLKRLNIIKLAQSRGANVKKFRFAMQLLETNVMYSLLVQILLKVLEIRERFSILKSYLAITSK